MAPKNSKPINTAVEDQLRNVVERMAAEGRASEILDVIQQSFQVSSGVPDQQGMSDASKRRREGATSWDYLHESPMTYAPSPMPERQVRQ